MKRKVIIEEVISKEFEIDIENDDTACEQIRKMYKKGLLVVEDPCLIQASAYVYNENNELIDWDASIH